MRFLRSVGGRFFAALVAVVLVVLATIYLIVIPTLNGQLESSRLDELQRSAETLAADVPSVNRLLLQPYAENTASAIDARMVVFGVVSPPLELLVLADSLATGTREIARDPIALEAASSGKLVRGTVERNGIQRAEVATPVPAEPGEVILLSSSLSNAEKSVSSVRKQLLIAVIPSVLLALAIGYFGGRWLTRRIRRLERAADRIATGHFEEPVVDDSTDEIGELARSFESMRVRLARLEEARREFIATASHELRTPIFALSGSLELLSDEEMDEPSRREFIETMQTQVDRLQRLTGALLDLSRLDAGRLDLTLEPVSLKAVAEALKKEFEAVAELSEHPFSVSLEAAPIVLADEQRMLQIGRILIENAFLHTPAGVPVAIRVEENADRGLLVVEDEGQGISEENRERVFERFFRLEGDRSSGSGLGLALAREWVTRMNGEITLESRPGLTRFALELPLQPSAGEQ